MLRLLALLLLIANGAFFAWSQGWLDSVSAMRAHGDREPERLARQVRPDAVRLLAAAAASAALAQADAAVPACLEAGPFGAGEVAAAEQALAVLPAGSWTRVTVDRPGRWVVYMGRFADAEALAKKEDEIRRRGVRYEVLSGAPEHEPGLVLGSYDNRAAADAALAVLVARDVRTARVLALAPPASVVVLRVERPTPALRGQLAALRGGALGAGFSACAR